LVAALNSIPDWYLTFSAVTLVTVSTQAKSLRKFVTRIKKRITWSEVSQMATKFITGLWWASACVVGSTGLAATAESG
jgi:hypothetical protein